MQLVQRQLGGGGFAATACAVDGHKGRGPRGVPNADGRNARRALVLVAGMLVGASSGHYLSMCPPGNYPVLKHAMANTV